MQKGTIGVTTENIFPIIKKFLYSEHEIFLRELVSNAVDATQKLKALALAGEYKNEIEDQTIRISIDKDKRTLTVSDCGIGMTSEEINKYINQIAFSSAEEFLDKYKDKIDAIIGHFGLGFYSSFMVSEKVEIVTKSYREGSQAVRWSCDGSPEFTLEDVEKEKIGTDIILYLDKNSDEFLEDSKVEELLKKFCKFLPVPIGFGKVTEWKDGKNVETGEDKIINNTKPAWTIKPSELKEEDYKKFYHDLYPANYDEPMFWIHLNVDYPFKLTGILYFPRIKTNLEIQKNKIQLYCNQVFVTDSVEGIVPDYLTLLHGVIDSPDIPLNVSRSYLQGDPNVKKISSHITKKVADRLQELFKNDRPEFEKKWDNLKLFMEYGMVTDEKFYERAEKFALLKNTDGKYFTYEEYENLIKENQTDKDKKIIYLYASDVVSQHSYIESAKNKGYDVIVMDTVLSSHFINHAERKFKDAQFMRIDSDVIEKLVRKNDDHKSKLPADLESDLSPVFKSQLPQKDNYWVSFDALSEAENPVIITQSEFMRRMKDMATVGGGQSFYGELPDSYNLVINTNNPLVKNIISETETKISDTVKIYRQDLKVFEEEKEKLEKKHKDKKDEDIPQDEKDRLEELHDEIKQINEKKDQFLAGIGKENQILGQVIDLAMLANNMLKGEALTKFVKRSLELIKK